MKTKILRLDKKFAEILQGKSKELGIPITIYTSMIVRKRFEITKQKGKKWEDLFKI